MLEADGGTLVVVGDLVGGSGLITGASLLEFTGASISTNITFQTSSTGTARSVAVWISV